MRIDSISSKVNVLDKVSSDKKGACSPLASELRSVIVEYASLELGYNGTPSVPGMSTLIDSIEVPESCLLTSSSRTLSKMIMTA